MSDERESMSLVMAGAFIVAGAVIVNSYQNNFDDKIIAAFTGATFASLGLGAGYLGINYFLGDILQN